MVFGLVILSFLFVSMCLWRLYTARFLRSLGRQSDFHLGTMMGGVALDFLRAVWASLSCGVSLPIGVAFHGITFATFIGLLIFGAMFLAGP